MSDSVGKSVVSKSRYHRPVFNEIASWLSGNLHYVSQCLHRVLPDFLSRFLFQFLIPTIAHVFSCLFYNGILPVIASHTLLEQHYELLPDSSFPDSSSQGFQTTCIKPAPKLLSLTLRRQLLLILGGAIRHFLNVVVLFIVVPFFWLVIVFNRVIYNPLWNCCAELTSLSATSKRSPFHRVIQCSLGSNGRRNLEPLTGQEVFFFSDPYMVVTACAYTETVRADDFRTGIGGKLLVDSRHLRRLQCKVEKVAGKYCWVQDDALDMSYHVEAVEGPRQSAADLEERLSQLSSEPLEPGRPLWRFLVIENAEHPQVTEYGKPRLGSVIVFRCHHCVADGVALIELFMNHILDAPSDRNSPDATPTQPIVPPLKTVSGNRLLRSMYVVYASLLAPLYLWTLLFWRLERSWDNYTMTRPKLSRRQHFSSPLSMELKDVKYIRNVLQSKGSSDLKGPIANSHRYTINDILMSLVVGGYTRYMDQMSRSATSERSRFWMDDVSPEDTVIKRTSEFTADDSTPSTSAATPSSAILLDTLDGGNTPHSPGTASSYAPQATCLSHLCGRSLSGALKRMRSSLFSHPSDQNEISCSLLSGRVCQRHINFLLPVNLRTAANSGDKMDLRNQFTSSIIKLPTCRESSCPALRVQAIAQALNDFKYYHRIAVFALFESLMYAVWPDLLNWIFDKQSRAVSAVFSNVAGPEEIRPCNGKKVFDLAFVVPRSHQIGVGISAISYGGMVHFTVASDRACLKNPNLLRRCILDETSHLLEVCRKIEE
eukprot:GHVQ01024892.1.p1 GENE.GHVQ01024892.1~~GHVQ01024892.1.p1  ORF type:complete len:770 (+),score=42.45 GHVQ01024892.1:183-2492(+)